MQTASGVAKLARMNKSHVFSSKDVRMDYSHVYILSD